MAEINRRIRLLELLKRFPWMFYPVRALYRTARHLPRQVLRHILPAGQKFGLAPGFYSGAQQVRSGLRDGKIILEGQPPPGFGDDTLVHLSRLNQDKNQPWPVFWLHEKDAYLSGDSLCLRDRKGLLMAESAFSPTGNRPDDPAYWQSASRVDLQLSGNVTSIVSRWSTQNYWHWPMDAISRLALLPQFPGDTKILVPPLRPWMTWFLRELGLENRWIETTSRAVQIENYYFSAPSSMTGCHNPFAVHFLREKFLPKRSPAETRPRRFYVRREGLTRGLHNEDEVREFFLKRGWALIAPETLSIPEQIALFADAEAVVALHGSALANLLWCSPGCRVLEFAPDNFLSGAFEMVARILDLPHDFMICPGDNRTHIRVDLAVLAQKLDQLGV